MRVIGLMAAKVIAGCLAPAGFGFKSRRAISSHAAQRLISDLERPDLDFSWRDAFLRKLF